MSRGTVFGIFALGVVIALSGCAAEPLDDSTETDIENDTSEPEDSTETDNERATEDNQTENDTESEDPANDSNESTDGQNETPAEEKFDTQVVNESDRDSNETEGNDTESEDTPEDTPDSEGTEGTDTADEDTDTEESDTEETETPDETESDESATADNTSDGGEESTTETESESEDTESDDSSSETTEESTESESSESEEETTDEEETSEEQSTEEEETNESDDESDSEESDSESTKGSEDTETESSTEEEPETALLTIEIVDAKTGEPVDGAVVTAQDQSGDEEMRSQTASAGNMNFGQPAGTYDVSVSAEGYLPQELVVEHDGTSQTTRVVELEPDPDYRPEVTIEVQVYDENGDPFEGATLTGPGVDETVGSDGTAEVTKREGVYVITADAEGYKPADMRLEFYPGVGGAAVNLFPEGSDGGGPVTEVRPDDTESTEESETEADEDNSSGVGSEGTPEPVDPPEPEGENESTPDESNESE